jgi:hypothetical protein
MRKPGGFWRKAMKSNVLAVIAVMLGAVTVAPAQSMVEYSTLSTHSATGALSAPTKALNHTTQQIAGTVSSNNSSGAKVWQEKGARAKDLAPAKPTPPAVFILANGQRLESSNYVLTANSLKLQQNDTQRTIPITELNVNATLAANHERGIDLKIPTSRTQMMLSF